MAKIILITAAIIFSSMLTGCNPPDMDSAQRTPRSERTLGQVMDTSAREMEAVEQMVQYRQGYRQALESLVSYYDRVGNDMKLQWAQQELDEFNRASRYDYIIEAVVAGPDLRASTQIAEADLLYREARDIEAGARRVLARDGDELRRALDKYNELIRRFPNSDKIDDAAYHAGQLYERFRDWHLAALYYQRAYQWNSDTPYPARYKAAFILDQRLNQRQQALELYRQSLEREDLRVNQSDFAQNRIEQLTRREQRMEELM